jgi:hypothetical protein
MGNAAELVVTNGGNCTDAPVRGELWWHGRTTTFLTPLRPAVAGPGRITDLAPHDAATLMVNAWTPLAATDRPAGDMSARLILFDRFDGKHEIRVTFSPPPRNVVPAGRCGQTTVRDGEVIYCEQPTGHDGVHMVCDQANGIVTTWNDGDEAGQDFLVMG